MIINGIEISNKIRVELKDQVLKLSIKPYLVVILVGNDPASEIYVKHKAKACEEVGIESTVIRLDSDISQELLEIIIQRYNDAPLVDGILVQLPLPFHIDRNRIFNIIDENKDVDVFNPINVGLLMQGRPRFVPCTPQGISMMFDYTGISVTGKHVVVISRSEIIGKPLFATLIQNNKFGNATVTVCHDHTPPDLLKKLCLVADIIIVAVGIPGFLTKDMAQPHQVVIDVGVNRAGNKIVGDVCHDVDVSWISPSVGGVGPLTICALLKNTIQACLRRKHD